MTPRGVPRSATVLMAAEAASLAVMSTLHLTGIDGGGTLPYRPSAAGAAEAVIATVLLAGAVAGWRAPGRAWAGAVAAVGFAIAGFLVGVTITLSGGPGVDIAYHCSVLPILLLTLGLLVRRPRDPAGPAGSAGPSTQPAGRFLYP